MRLKGKQLTFEYKDSNCRLNSDSTQKRDMTKDTQLARKLKKSYVAKKAKDIRTIVLHRTESGGAYMEIQC